MLLTTPTMTDMTYIGLAIENSPTAAPMHMAIDPKVKFTSDKVKVYIKNLPGSGRRPAM